MAMDNGPLKHQIIIVTPEKMEKGSQFNLSLFNFHICSLFDLFRVAIYVILVSGHRSPNFVEIGSRIYVKPPGPGSLPRSKRLC